MDRFVPATSRDLRIIDAMLAVPREAFVPEGSKALPISTSISTSARAERSKGI